MAEEFRDRDLKGARFVESDLSDVLIRGCEISGMDIDAPWLPFGKPLLVNGVDVVAYVEEELNRRFPGRPLWRATDPEGLRRAWQAVEDAWDAAIARAATLPAGTVDEVVRMVDRSEYKRRQAAPGIRITPKAFGRDRRLPITNRFGG